MKIKVTWQTQHSVIVEAPSKKEAAKMVEEMTYRQLAKDKSYLIENVPATAESVDDREIKEQLERVKSNHLVGGWNEELYS